MADQLLQEIEAIGGWAEELVNQTRDVQQDDAKQVYAAAEELYNVWQDVLNAGQLTDDQAAQAMKELRRPLNTISGFTHPHIIGQYGDLPLPMRNLYHQIQGASSRLINEMMDALGI